MEKDAIALAEEMYGATLPPELYRMVSFANKAANKGLKPEQEVVLSRQNICIIFLLYTCGARL